MLTGRRNTVNTEHFSNIEKNIINTLSGTIMIFLHEFNILFILINKNNRKIIAILGTSN